MTSDPIINNIGIPLEMGQPGWKGSLRVAGLFMAGIIVGGLGAGVAEQDKYLVGSSPGTYALIMAHLGMICNQNYQIHDISYFVEQMIN